MKFTKRIVSVLLIAVVATVGFVAPTQAASVNDFVISKFDAKYELSKDSEGRSSLKTVETITAEFVNRNTNHGLERAIPKTYDGHSTSLRIETVTDETGRSLEYSSRSQNNNELLRIGNPDSYVYGQKTYVITYTQRDVTKEFANMKSAEFYWDVNGTQWQQPMTQVSARLSVAQDIANDLTGDTACYQGAQGASNRCTITKTGETSFSVNSFDLSRGENITIAVGFKPQTFAPYKMSEAERIAEIVGKVWVISLIVTTALGILLLIMAIVRRSRVMRRVKGRGTIIAEYVPPKDTSVQTSAIVLVKPLQSMTATLLDLAIRGYIVLIETKEKSMFKPAEYDIEIKKSIADLLSEEQTLLATMFDTTDPAVGTRFAMKSLQKAYKKQAKLRANQKALVQKTRGEYGLYDKAETERPFFKKVGWIALIISVLTLSPALLAISGIIFILGATLWPLTEKGVALRDYLYGLKEYIKVAEQDRIKMLQSPEGAEKTGVTINEGETEKVVKLYEKVLPYAVLFGLEKQWLSQLGAYYDQQSSQPDWYTGSSAFNAAIFAGAISNFGSSVNSYSSPESSSSGGSGGGGSSGGGGGGGGGGGW